MKENNPASTPGFHARLLAAVEQAVIAADLTGTVTYWNEYAARLYGWRAEEAVGRNLGELIVPQLGAAQGEEIMELLRRGESWTGEFTVRHRDGRDFLAQVSDSPILDETGKLVGIIGISQDITERKRAEETMRRRDEHMRLLMESVKDYAIFTMDVDRRITSWNTGAEEMFGYTAAEIIGQWTDALFVPEDLAVGAPEEELRTALEHGRAADERWHLRKDGSRFYASGVVNVLHNGDVHGFVKVARDLTERKQADEAIRQSEERHRIMIEAAGLATWDWDLIADEADCNETHFQLFGLEPRPRPHSIHVFTPYIHPDDLPQVQQSLTSAIEGAGLHKADFRVLRADTGQTVWLASYGRAVQRDAAGRATRMTGVLYDITGRKETEQRKEEFLGVASHELKTPLTSIKAYAEVLEDMVGTDDPEAADVVRKLDDSINRLDDLIRALLDATRINEGRMEIKREALDLAALARETAEDFSRTTATHRLEVEADHIPIVKADRERIRQVLSNILSNAIKYSPAADRITIRLARKRGMVEVCVEDFGVGISAAAADRVFERFFREPDPNVSTFPGLGLGLYIAWEIVQLHGGQLTVKSRKGKGSTFCFTLPVGA